MRELELDGIHDDGEHLVLLDSDGERYTLRIDEALRAAVRRDRPALGLIQAADATSLRPKEIQAMLRSGRSAEDIAEAAQIPVDHVRRYEGPVLAERGWTAQRARGFHVGRGGPRLDEMVAARLAARQASQDTAWDAWRRTDGTWTLELVFSAAGRTRQAHWIVDLDNRTVTATDDEARWISDENPPPEPNRGRARLMAVKSSVYDLEADGSFEEGERPQRRRPTVSSEHPAAIDEAELDALNARRGLRPVPHPQAQESDRSVWSSLEDDVTEDSDREDTDAADQEAWVEHSSLEDSEDTASDTEGTEDEDPSVEVEGSDVAADEPEEAEEIGETEHEHPRPAVTDQQDTVDLTPLPGFETSPRTGDAPGATEQKPAKDSPAPRKAGKSRSKRASMPSWDEIVFGSKHD